MMASLSGNARDDGPRRAVRDRREVRASRTAPVIALVGDGAMQMNGLNELITIGELLASAGAIRDSSSSCSTTAT